MKKISPIYLDSASTSKVDSRVLDEMLPYFLEYFGNASSYHLLGKKSKEAIEKARSQVSNIINCDSKEIIFTSGATESINLAIKGFTESNVDKGNHVITVKTEHKAVLATCEYLETKGFEVTYLDVDNNGLISIDQLKSSVKDNTILVIVMYVNNETGVIQPINEIGKVASELDIAFFCDATQTIGKLPVDVVNDNIDMLCFSGHKINGPKGIGVLYKKKNIELTPLIHGGGQEYNLRSGTYNTPLIVGLGKACEIANIELEKNIKKLLLKKKEIEEYYEVNNIGKVNFKYVKKAPHIISITLNDYEAEEYLIIKSNEFYASTGSACNSEVIEISHVLRAMNIDFPKKIIRISI
ncbi:cysteine desulfurase family protein [Aurantibacter aestuarii]|uniref:cysteine desulfurase n=1 Tax=Aurantibacter aestuarii TaxID=1266046 RepID=A0A2T1N8X6_9FLAO|nr:cysteine desulfurase family protein [Aurantibacter aestuarii]PSG88311.1 cysteine desulfurase [Aurantibacter aestuarii]